MAEPYYTTATALRSYLGVNSTTLPDARALVLIESAEDAIDQMLGAWPVDETTGRRIVQSDIEAWQWSKLGRATMLLAAQLYSKPDALQGPRYRKESGPDFAVEDPLTGPVPSTVMTVLDASGLRRLAGRAVVRRPIARLTPNSWDDGQW